MTENDRADLLVDYISRMEESACMCVMLSKEKRTNAQSIIYVDTDGNDTEATVYDFTYHTWKSTDSFDKLADGVLGSCDYGTLLAYFNGVANESEIEAGTKIKIPVLTEASSNTDNRVYAESDKQESYGVDITLDDEGDFAVGSDGDIKTVDGRDNLTQAIALRLTTASGKRIRLGTYGIRSTIGDPIAVESYLSGCIEQTIKADPRIAEVNELAFEGDGDKLKLEVVYTDINGNTGIYKGEM